MLLSCWRATLRRWALRLMQSLSTAADRRQRAGAGNAGRLCSVEKWQSQFGAGGTSRKLIKGGRVKDTRPLHVAAPMVFVSLKH